MRWRVLFMSIAALLFGAPKAGAAGALDFVFTGIEGENISLKDYAGNAVLIVNTASKCGFTKQYEGLQALWNDYKDKGLVVIGVPSNDFGAQEPGSAAEIKEFCEVNYAIDFPMTQKTVVKGDAAHPFYRFAREQFGFVGAPKWNFHKYLINAEGTLTDYFSSTTSPDSSTLKKAVEAALPK